MKENSIEEDIKILESIIEEYENCSVPEIDMQINVTFREKQNNALNNVLSDYKRALKENEELRENYISAQACANMVFDKVIPVQKVKDKIEELKEQDREWTEELSEPDSNFKDIDRNLKRIKNQIDVLQELLEGRKEKEE